MLHTIRRDGCRNAAFGFISKNVDIDRRIGLAKIRGSLEAR
jgi:hypothetical protein